MLSTSMKRGCAGEPAQLEEKHGSTGTALTMMDGWT